MIEPHRVADTAAFVASLPRTGVVVFVMDKADACLVRDLRTSMHGTDAMASTHVLVAPTETDEALLMRGRPDDILVFREPIMVQRRNMASMSILGTMAEPRVPRREPAPGGVCACGYSGPGWCSAMLCGRRPPANGIRITVSTAPKSSGGAIASSGWVYPRASTAERPKPVAEVSLGGAPQILDLMEAGFTFTEASGLSEAERDLYAQLIAERAQVRERESRVRSRDLRFVPHAA